MSSAHETPRPSLRTLVLILGTLAAFGPMSIDMYLPAFPRIAQDFGVNVAAVQLSLSSYFLGLALGQLLYGPLLDRLGRKTPLLFGLVIYALSSGACALVSSSEGLVLFRFLQALGGCAGMVASRAAVRDLFDARESARVFSLLMLVMGVAPIIAPLLGGQLATHWGWRSIFYVLLCFSLISLVAVVRFFPETRAADPSVRLRAALPNYWQIAQDKRFLAHAFTGGIAQGGMFAYITGSPFVLIELFGIPAESYGWVFGSNAFGLIAASQLNARLLRTRHPEKVLRAVLKVSALAGLALLGSILLKLPLIAVLPPLFLFVASLGLVNPNSNALAMASQGAQAGRAAALLGTLQFSCAALASLAVSAFFNGTAVPMAAVIAICGVLALLINAWIRETPTV